MKRLLVALAISLSIAGTASAQNLLYENPDNKPYFGARLGLDVTSTAGAAYDTYNNGAGFNVGAIYNIPVIKNFYFEPGLALFYNTFGQTFNIPSNDFVREVNTSIRNFGFRIPFNDFVREVNTSIRNFGFRIPFNFGYRFDFTDDMSIYIYTGPVLNISLTAKEHINAFDENPATSYSLMGKGFKRADLQWDFGVGYSYNQLYVQVGGGVGATKVFSSNVESYRRNTFNIAVGYNF